MGIRDRPTAPRSPWQNGYVERLIGSIRRECLDHVITVSERHLRRVLVEYSDYYNTMRTHRSLRKDAPIGRPVKRQGEIRAFAHLGGLQLGRADLDDDIANNTTALNCLMGSG